MPWLQSSRRHVQRIAIAYSLVVVSSFTSSDARYSGRQGYTVFPIIKDALSVSGTPFQKAPRLIYPDGWVCVSLGVEVTCTGLTPEYPC